MYPDISSFFSSAIDAVRGNASKDPQSSPAGALGNIAQSVSTRQTVDETSYSTLDTDHFQSASTPYLVIPWDLKYNDKDSTNRWGGKKRQQSAQYITDLQKRLTELGYWTSKHNQEHGTKCDGHYGHYTMGAVATCQLENLAINDKGDVDGSKVTGILDETTLGIINNLSKRPTHLAKNALKAKTKADPVPFKQLPPSPYFLRYTPNYHNSSKPQFRIPGVDENSKLRIMADNWGQSSMIDMILNVTRIWIEDNNKETLLVGDISLFSGGTIEPHSTHKYGLGVDIDHNKYCSVNKDEFDVDASLALALLFVQQGAKTVYFNCHHVIKNCSAARHAGGHHHHFHVDQEFVTTTGSSTNKKHTTCAECKKFSTCNYKITKVAKKDSNGNAGDNIDYKPNTHKVNNSKRVYLNKDLAPNGKWYVTETAD